MILVKTSIHWHQETMLGAGSIKRGVASPAAFPSFARFLPARLFRQYGMEVPRFLISRASNVAVVCLSAGVCVYRFLPSHLRLEGHSATEKRKTGTIWCRVLCKSDVHLRTQSHCTWVLVSIELAMGGTCGGLRFVGIILIWCSTGTRDVSTWTDTWSSSSLRILLAGDEGIAPFISGLVDDDLYAAGDCLEVLVSNTLAGMTRSACLSLRLCPRCPCFPRDKPTSWSPMLLHRSGRCGNSTPVRSTLDHQSI